MTIGIIILLFFQISSGEITPLERALSGCPWLVVNVQGAENNPQRVLIDTGSTHSYIINHNMMRSLPLARNRAFSAVGGIRGSFIPVADLASIDATHIDYEGFSGLVLTRWTRRRFTVGSHSEIWGRYSHVGIQTDLASLEPVQPRCLLRLIAISGS